MVKTRPRPPPLEGRGRRDRTTQSEISVTTYRLCICQRMDVRGGAGSSGSAIGVHQRAGWAWGRKAGGKDGRPGFQRGVLLWWTLVGAHWHVRERIMRESCVRAVWEGAEAQSPSSRVRHGGWLWGSAACQGGASGSWRGVSEMAVRRWAGWRGSGRGTQVSGRLIANPPSCRS